MRKFITILMASLCLFLGQAAIQAQTTGAVSGSVTDPNKAVVPGASIVISNDATKQEFTAVANDEGSYRISGVPNGMYTATATGKGFKKSIITMIKVDVGLTSNLNIQMEVGGAAEQVTVVGTGELLRTENATVGTTLNGRQITDLPNASRDALDLVLSMPGTTTPGRPRSSTINGLPKGALNITLDGINVQDNLLKSSDGFFTYVRPRTDAIGEVTVSTSNPGAESSAEGAVQIKFVTQNGGNDYRGGIYWYHRNPALNTNYWFSNRDLPADPVTHKAPQQRIILNQFGGKYGGPISIPGLFNGKDKAFFFVNYEEYRLPEKSPLRTKTVLSSTAQSGTYQFTAATTYTPPAGSTITCAPSGTSQVCSFNLLAKATALGIAGLPGTSDSIVSSLLTSIRGSLSGATVVNTGDPNLQQASFYNVGGQTRKFPTVRFDFNVTKNHHIENIWNYQSFRSKVDFLNSVDPAFPGFPNFGSQDSIRFSNSTGWRWNITPTLVNEARYGIVGGTVLFFPEVNAGQFANQGGLSLSISAAGISNATVSNGPQRRNSPVKQLTDTLTWVKGNHSFQFGASWSQINLFNRTSNAVPGMTFALSSTLEASNFTSLVGALPSGNQGAAAALYAVLTARIASVSANANLDEDSLKLVYNGLNTQRVRQVEYGFFGQDTWKIRPNLTLTLGLRNEMQGPMSSASGVFSFATIEGLWGESGVGNNFKPGTLTGTPTVYNQFAKGAKAWNADNFNPAPSLGVAWTPHFNGSVLKWLAGESGQMVLRGGFSRAYVREGTNTFTSILGSNPGATISATRNITGTPFSLPVGLLLRNGTPAPPAIPSSLTFPYAGTTTDSVNVFDPNLKTGYVDSYTVGIQRELNSNTAIEVRYVGNRGKNLWRQYNINEPNVIENGFMAEFALAQQNLAANVAAGRGANFRYAGTGTGTNPLPIMMAYISGLAPTAANASNTANYTNSLFANSTLLNPLNPLNPSPVTLANTFGQTGNASLFEPTRISAGIPINFFYANPGKRGGGAFIVDNSAKTYYDAVTFEFRRRLSGGLLIQSNYTFGRATGNTFASSSVNFDQPATLRPGKDMRKGLSPFDITHGFKTNFIYELPVGRGKAFLGSSGKLVNGFLGGWGFNGNVRIQSGTVFNLGNVQLVGMTVKDLQKAVGVYRGDTDAGGTQTNRDVYVFPLDIRQNTYKANNISLVSGVPTFTQGAPSGRYIAPAGAGNCLQAYTGQCGFNNLILHGPAFFRYDLSMVKKFRFSERTNLELRGEFLNAFNNINFLVGAAANDVNGLGGLGATTFGRYTAAYQDTSTTNDPGGRLIQLVMRLNF